MLKADLRLDSEVVQVCLTTRTRLHVVCSRPGHGRLQLLFVCLSVGSTELALVAVSIALNTLLIVLVVQVEPIIARLLSDAAGLHGSHLRSIYALTDIRVHLVFHLAVSRSVKG